MIRIADLQFSYRQSAFRLAIPTLEIPALSATAIIGPSGCGKTTLLRIIAGIQLPHSGRVEVAGEEINALGDAARRRFRMANIGFVFQEFALLEYLNVRENVLLSWLMDGGLRVDNAVKERADKLCAELGLSAAMRQKPDTLSQGEKQRVAICRALIGRPKLILADEPTGNLDPTNKRRTIEMLLGHARAAGATLVVVTHDHSLLQGFDRVIDAADFGHAEAMP